MSQSGPSESVAMGEGNLNRVLRAADGVEIHATYHPSAESGTDEPVLVVGHGFTGFRAKDDNQRVNGVLAQRLPLVTLDFRGHGESGGMSTLGLREVLDLDAAVTWARELGHTRVVTVGFSMGSCIAVRHAALIHTTDRGHVALRTEHAPDAVVSVSGTAFWFYRGTPPMRLVHRAVSTRAGRAVLQRVSGTRVDVSDWEVEPLPYSPEEAAGFIAPTPFLIVHGDADHYFPLEHPEAVHRGATVGARERGLESSVDFWVEHGFAHAESAIQSELLDRICDWAVNVTRRST